METDRISIELLDSNFLTRVNAISRPYVILDTITKEVLSSHLAGRREIKIRYLRSDQGYCKGNTVDTIQISVFGYQHIWDQYSMEIFGYIVCSLGNDIPEARGVQKESATFPRYFKALLTRNGGFIWFLWKEEKEPVSFWGLGERRNIKDLPIIGGPSLAELAMSFSDRLPVFFEVEYEAIKNKNTVKKSVRVNITINSLLITGKEEFQFTGIEESSIHISGSFSVHSRKGEMICNNYTPMFNFCCCPH